MSHGPSTDGSKAEPNLIPLLDVVLQLIMFFMICANFAADQVNESIQLPVAQSARPMDRRKVDVLYLNLDKNGELLVPGKEKPLSLGQWNAYLKQAYADAERLDRDKGGKGEVQTIVIIRADENNDYKQVYALLQACKKVGYRKLELRAMTQG